MINFACRQFEISDIIKCSFGLSKSDYEVFLFQMENKNDWYSTQNLSRFLGLNLTTVQRSVKKLYEKDILRRKQVNLENGGYVYLYNIEHKDKIRKMILDIIKKWSQRVEKELREL
ncbi:MarR family transcriptional regulator [Candidatus Woesearchaeota archaeon]|nr:MarR family transcriptional regulator [Candidatus Woesearchaeota archaeon]